MMMMMIIALNCGRLRLKCLTGFDWRDFDAQKVSASDLVSPRKDEDLVCTTSY